MTSFVEKHFDQLTLQELYELLALRTDVFVVEQECAYRELDFYDQKAQHLMLFKNGKLVGYSRILPPGSPYQLPSIGRVVVREQERGQGTGRKLFQKALELTQLAYPGTDIKIQAQCYLENFYKDFGFKVISEAYPDSGVMHVDMIRLYKNQSS